MRLFFAQVLTKKYQAQNDILIMWTIHAKNSKIRKKKSTCTKAMYELKCIFSKNKYQNKGKLNFINETRMMEIRVKNNFKKVNCISTISSSFFLQFQGYLTVLPQY